MRKEIIKRGAPENRVLYEENEPLFPPLKHDRRRFLRMAFCCAAVLVCIACVIVGISASGAAAGGNTQGSGDGDMGSESTDAYSDTQTRFEGAEPPFEDTDDEDSDEDGDETEKESQTEAVDDTLDTPIVSENTETDYAFADISELERGEEYVVNYTSKAFDVEGLLDRGFVYSEQKNSQAPLVMIIHTHTGEQYLGNDGGYRNGLNTVVSVGDRINTLLNARGLSTVHCTVIHDGGDGNAYIAARETIKTMLKIYPSIKYVIDVHRMEMDDEEENALATLVTADGAAQMRLTVGTDIKSDGEWQDDLSLALALRGELNGGDVRACAPVVVSHGGYNGDLSRFFLMLDVGAEGNTTASAIKAGEMFAKALAEVVLGK